MAKKPRFSIIIPALNEEKYLPKLLDSLVGQTNKDFEVIVSNGPSTDDTKKVALSYKKKLPTLTVVESDIASLPVQRNTGASAAQGAWYVFADADTVFLPYALERIDTHIKTTSPDAFTTWCRSDSEEVKDAILALWVILTYEGSFFVNRPFATPGPLAVISKDVFDAVDGYNEEAAFVEDVELSRRLLKQGYTQSILREALYCVSLRRYRTKGVLRVIQQYAIATLPVLILNRSPRVKQMPGYVMGGHIYDEEEKKERSLFARYEKKLRKLTRVMFD